MKLKGRNINLGTPVNNDEWKRLDQQKLFVHGTIFKTIYSEFDGFLSQDDRSQIMLWSLGDIIEKSGNILRSKFDQNRWFCIGDFLIESDYIIYDINEKRPAVRSLDGNEELSKDLKTSLDELVCGHYDFVK